MQRDLTQKGYIEFIANLLSSTLTKGVSILATVRTNKKTHVFDYSKYWNVKFVEHTNRLDSDIHRHILRGGYNQNTSDRESLSHRKRGIACPWRQIYEKVIQFSPFYI